MEIKKSKRANLENKKGLFLQIGVTLAVAMALVAFEWASQPGELQLQYVDQTVDIGPDYIPPTRPIIKPPPPPPKPIEIINIVVDEAEIEEPTFTGIDVDEGTLFDYVPYEPEEEPEEIPAVFLDEKPMFQGGDVNQFRVYVANHLIYPKVPAENGISGRVFLQFTVNTRGEVENVIVVKGIHPEIDAEAVRVVRSSPKWKPGKQAGRPVKAQYQFSIVFALN